MIADLPIETGHSRRQLQLELRLDSVDPRPIQCLGSEAAPDLPDFDHHPVQFHSESSQAEKRGKYCCA